MASPPSKKRMRDEDKYNTASDTDFTLQSSKLVDDSRSVHHPSPIPYIVVHRVKCNGAAKYHTHHELSTDYFDTPQLRTGTNRTSPLRGQKQLPDIESYLEDHTGLSFAVYISYSCTDYHESRKDAFKRLPMPQMDEETATQVKPYFYVLPEDGPLAKPFSESLMLSEGLNEALGLLHSQNPDVLRDWSETVNLGYPYFQLYHQRGFLTGAATQLLSNNHQAHMDALAKYLHEHMSCEYDEAQTLFDQGSVKRAHWAKMFRPNEVIIKIEGSQTQAFMMPTCPTFRNDLLMLSCWSWAFDGKFFKKDQVLRSNWPSKDDEVNITDLQVYPLRYATTELQDKLRRRGEVFWACRRRKYVKYDVPLQGMGVQLANLRYMVDMETYKLMHSDEEPPTGRIELSDIEMQDDAMPAEPFSLLLPNVVRGFGFHNKKWDSLVVEHICDIEWNKETFDHQLVLKEEKKELIRALVSVHIVKQSDVRTDFMDGKGEGLIILLHGGPGTGKTLTAESVAEFAEKPLYRVTCGDIGTDPEGVEKYLESVLFIGSTWGCVVLLDEADVFLEERTKMDMQRNALVSVFLRVLEYYDGILILTSNRIGTFDEAFKSRVQLALHYPPLDADGRQDIWNNFLQFHQDGGEKGDFDGMKKKLHTLAQHKLNGRQIRNIIKTAKDLARYRKESLRYTHVDQAVRVVNDFEKYVLDVHGHEDEEYARELGNR